MAGRRVAASHGALCKLTDGLMMMGQDESRSGPAASEGTDFIEHRAELIRLAFGLTGSLEDAEDAVQEVWLRWQRHRGSVGAARPWLYTVTRNVVIDRFRERSALLSTNLDLAPWHEPVAEPGPSAVELALDLRPGFHLVMVSLSALERVVFVLHEGMSWPYLDVARLLGRSEAAVRQLGHRAQQHLASRSPRFAVDPAAVDVVVGAYIQVAGGGDVTPLVEALAPGLGSQSPIFTVEDRMVVHDVAGIVLFKQGRLLLCRRRDQLAWYPGAWDVPGAHRRHGEPAIACAVRAAKHKLGVGVTNPQLWGEHCEDDFRLTLFVGDHWDGEPRNLEWQHHREIGLFTRQQAAALPLADRRLLRLFDRSAT